MPQADVAPRYLEDFAVGDVTKTGDLTVTAEMVRNFAELYDPQPMHLDEDAARASVFGDLVGSGWQTLAVTMRLLVDARLLGGTPIVGAEFKETRFHAPMKPGDTLRVTAEVLAVRSSKSRPDRGFMDMKVTTRTREGTALVTQQWTLVLPTRAGLAA
ncbi:MAG: MaoC family dehydratase [Proteobacteria bacterium]|nr:MaoC family dehydratase [Pseudomonadota bacterium]